MIHWIMQALNYRTDANYPMPLIMPAPFSDENDISETYRGNVYSSVVLKLVNGRGNNMLFPKDGATRAESVTTNHTSGQKYDFKLFDAAGSDVYTWSADKMFIALMNETAIGAGEEIVFSDTIDSGTNKVLHLATSLKSYIVGTSDDFAIAANGYETVIVH